MKNPLYYRPFTGITPMAENCGEIAARAASFNDLGINMVWLPPAYKGASGGYSVGYDTYDLFDLVSLIKRISSHQIRRQGAAAALIDALQSHDIAVLLDVVVNHKMGADEKEPCSRSAREQQDRHANR
jgi:alpha-amylase